MASDMEFPLRFKRQYAEPLDADTYAETIAELDDIKIRPNSYVGMLVSCKEDGIVYKLGLDMEFKPLGNGDNSIWKGTREDWAALSSTEKQKYDVICFTNDYNDPGLIDDGNISTQTTYSSEKIENSLTEKAEIDDTSTSALDATWSASKIYSAINSIGFKGDAPANANSATTPGVYFINRSDDVYPVRQGYLIVSKPRQDYGCILQEVYNYSANAMYSRGCWFNNWYDWREIATMNKVNASTMPLVLDIYRNDTNSIDISSVSDGVYLVSANNLYSNWNNWYVGTLVKYNNNIVVTRIAGGKITDYSEDNFEIIVSGTSLISNSAKLWGLKLYKIGYN